MSVWGIDRLLSQSAWAEWAGGASVFGVSYLIIKQGKLNMPHQGVWYGRQGAPDRRRPGFSGLGEIFARGSRLRGARSRLRTRGLEAGARTETGRHPP